MFRERDTLVNVGAVLRKRTLPDVVAREKSHVQSLFARRMMAQIPVELTGTRLRGTSMQPSLRRLSIDRRRFRIVNERLTGDWRAILNYI